MQAMKISDSYPIWVSCKTDPTYKLRLAQTPNPLPFPFLSTYRDTCLVPLVLRKATTTYIGCDPRPGSLFWRFAAERGTSRPEAGYYSSIGMYQTIPASLSRLMGHKPLACLVREVARTELHPRSSLPRTYSSQIRSRNNCIACDSVDWAASKPTSAYI
jgi:hypothetical protein